MVESFTSAGVKIFPYKNAWMKYKWADKEDGLCVQEVKITIATMAGKHILFKVKGYRKHYAIAPEDALKVAKERRSFFYDRSQQLVAVIPKSACYAVEKA